MIPDFGPRYLLGRRLHHGLAGVVLAALGIVLIIDDWKDRWWKLEVRVVKKSWWQRLR